MHLSTINGYTINDGARLQVDVLDYGARITAIRFDDVDIACGYSNLERYRNDEMYLGATIGPICNRIAQGQLSIEGQQFQMPRNEGAHTLHSGGVGFDKQTWTLVAQSADTVHFRLHYDLQQAGLAGNLVADTVYQVIGNTLQVSYNARCDQPTYVNMTNHVYLNLSGQRRPIDDHQFKLLAKNFVAVDSANIPTGELTQLDQAMEYSIATPAPHSEFAGLCDHHFNVGETDSPTLRDMLEASCASTGIRLNVAGTAPGFQFYTGRHMHSPFGESGGFCVETQYAPDAINQPDFFSPLLQPDSEYRQTAQYQFSRQS